MNGLSAWGGSAGWHARTEHNRTSVSYMALCRELSPWSLETGVHNKKYVGETACLRAEGPSSSQEAEPLIGEACRQVCGHRSWRTGDSPHGHCT